MKTCTVNKLVIGGDAPVRIMGVINVSTESFYTGSYIPTDKVHEAAVAMIEQGADMIDVGARSTAPNVQPISGKEEADRIDAALRELDGTGITLSVDTMHPGVLDICLLHEIHAANDIGGMVSPVYAKKVADAGLPAIVMAANQQPGDPVGVAATLASLEGVVKRCEAAGIREYVLDPGIGIWTPFRSVEDDWELCRHFDGFLKFDRPLLAAVSRKTFIGMLTNRQPEERLPGTLAVTADLLLKGASVIRTHDVAATLDLVKVHNRLKGA